MSHENELGTPDSTHGPSFEEPRGTDDGSASSSEQPVSEHTADPGPQRGYESQAGGQGSQPADSGPYGGYQLQPGGYQADPGGYQADPGGYQVDPGGYQADPGGYQAQPGGYGSEPAYGAQPGGYQGQPGEYGPQTGYNAQPGAYQGQPGAYQPGGYQTYGSQPGGYQQQPGGYQQYGTAPGGYGSVAPYKSKTTAALLAFFLGGFGMHDFYLGKKNLGLVHVVLVVLGLLIIIGAAIGAGASQDPNSPLFALIIPGYLLILGNNIWALVEFVMILVKPEHELGR